MPSHSISFKEGVPAPRGRVQGVGHIKKRIFFKKNKKVLKPGSEDTSQQRPRDKYLPEVKIP